MIAYGMNRWKSVKASEFATAEGSGQVRTTDEGDDPPIKKSLPAAPAPKDDGAAMSLSKLMRPAGGESADKPIKKSLRVRGSERLQAVRPDANPGPSGPSGSDERGECGQGRRRWRRRRRTTRSLGRPSSLP